MYPRMSQPRQEQASQDDLSLLGLNPAQPQRPLNLAGADVPLPAPQALADAGEPQGGDLAGQSAAINAPTFSAPDTRQPGLREAAGLANGSIDWHPGLQPEPSLPDLDEYARPYALDIYGSSNSAPAMGEPWFSDILWETRVSPLETEAGAEPLDVLDGRSLDLFMSELEPPQLELDARMTDHPGSMAPDALADLHDSPDYQDLPRGVSMTNNNLLQPGSTRRTRHEAPQFLGLDALGR
jgi:hypothetical protein